MLPNFWSYKTVLSFKHPIDQTVQTGPFGAQLHSDDYVDEGVPFILIKNIQDGTIDPEGMPCITHADARRLANYALQKNDIVFSRVGRVGSCFLVEDEHIGWVISGQLLRLRLDLSNLDPHFLIHWIRSQYVERYIGNESVGSTRQSINSNILSNMPIPNIPLVEQRHITYILDTLDTTIRQTEAIIAKLQQVKQGLLHDLLTRGIDTNGQLRPPVEQAPHLYKESPLGWIPKEWEVTGLKEKAPSLRSVLRTGPFGSSLKGEHWRDTGRPVVTIGSLGTGKFIEEELLYVSEEKAHALSDFQLITGDIVFSRVADVGRSVVVAEKQSGWIMSSNFMRISININQANPYFLQQTFTFDSRIKAQIRSNVNSGGRDVANSAVLMGLSFVWPKLNEQNEILRRANINDKRISKEEENLAKLKSLKSALMDDLLTGRMRVTALLSGETRASTEPERKSA